jgi:quercetin dioxygenase-like cupin family protein
MVKVAFTLQGRKQVKVVRFNEAETYEPEKDWKRASLCNQADISIEHFVKPPKHASPWHDHSNAQVLVVLKGRLSVTTDGGGEQFLSEGDAAYIPGGEPHIVTNALDEPSMGLDIFVPGRSFDFWAKRKNSEG